MKTKTFLAVLAVVAGAALSGSALAQWHGGHGGGHVRFGINIGVPLYAPYYAPYYPPYYYPPYPAPYYPPAVVVQSPPATYVEQAPVQASPGAPQGDWFYCADQKAYYPYVRQCPGGWQRVPAQPQN